MRRKTVFLVSDSSELMKKWRHWLWNWRYYYSVTSADADEQAIEAIKRIHPDFAVIDASAGSAAEVCLEMRLTGNLSLVIDTSEEDNNIYWLGDMMADNYIHDSVGRDMFEAKIGAMLNTFPVKNKESGSPPPHKTPSNYH